MPFGDILVNGVWPHTMSQSGWPFDLQLATVPHMMMYLTLVLTMFRDVLRGRVALQMENLARHATGMPSA
ncbi:MAG: hypothetical protein H7840_17810 [Alphaproteobacteria bacterium]